MRIYFERNGGFMGRQISCSVDTTSLPSDEAIALQEMVAAASFFELPASVESIPQGYDDFQYKLIVEDNDVKLSVELSDSAAPDTLRPLLRKLTILTRSQPGSSALRVD